MPGTPLSLEVRAVLPEPLARIEELANDLWYSWDRPTRALFAKLDRAAWNAVGHSPKAFLKRVDQRALDAAAGDPLFLAGFQRVLSAFDTYHARRPRLANDTLGEHDLVAYFCAEFGLHESLPIYSGGLGILAGDHCKAASDIGLPFVGLGLLYRQGYFFQTIDGLGVQHATYADSDFAELPIVTVLDAHGDEMRVRVPLGEREVAVRLWRTRVGHVSLLLLDADIPENSPHDRGITHRLYGGDRTTRIEQEIVLGVGGVRALAALGLVPTVWHINEGHAAFQILERVRALGRDGVGIEAALEAVASNTVFTTHTAVPAGHDAFGAATIDRYFTDWCTELGVGRGRLLRLGAADGDGNGDGNGNDNGNGNGDGDGEFNMTALAIRGSRFQNGVSRIHGRVSSRICAPLWPQIEADENPIDAITNGVHVPTFLSDAWSDLFAHEFGTAWNPTSADAAAWEAVVKIPDRQFWTVRQSLKVQMIHLVRHRIAQTHARNHGSDAHLDRLLRLADPENPDVLTIGFARRFATYKRATLLFERLDWLREIVGDRERPVLFVFAGKAHPADEPGRALIRRVHEVAAMPEFEGSMLLVEGYDLRLGRRLVQGVDVWLNNPIYPLEASGTSGMKAAMNGVVNLSVLDGWWNEAFDGGNGWAIKPVRDGLDEHQRARDEARTLYEILQDRVIPLYYDRGPQGFSPGWIAMAKRSMATIGPRFNAARMVGEYLDKCYAPAARQWRRYASDGFALARSVAAWKAKVRAAWSGVALRATGDAARSARFGDSLRYEVAVRLNGLDPGDVAVELVLGRAGASAEQGERALFALEPVTASPDGEWLYAIELSPEWCGKMEVRFRAFPCHEHLTHRFETGLMCWL